MLFVLSRGNAPNQVNHVDNQLRGEARHGVTESRGQEHIQGPGTVNELPYINLYIIAFHLLICYDLIGNWNLTIING